MAGFNRLPEIIVAIRAIGIEAQSKAATDWATEAASRAPVLTGALRASVHAVGSAHMVTVDAVNEQGTPYGGFVEYGTSYMAAQPFFGPAEAVAEAKCQTDLIGKLRAL